MFVLLALVNRSTLCNPLTSLRHMGLGLSSVAAFIECWEQRQIWELDGALALPKLLSYSSSLLSATFWKSAPHPKKNLCHHPAVPTREMWNGAGCGRGRSGSTFWCSPQPVCPTSLCGDHAPSRSTALWGLMYILAQLQKESSPPLDKSFKKLFLACVYWKGISHS